MVTPKGRINKKKKNQRVKRLSGRHRTQRQCGKPRIELRTHFAFPAAASDADRLFQEIFVRPLRTEYRAEETRHLVWLATAILGELDARAQANQQEAAEQLLHLVTDFVVALDQLAHQNPELLRPLVKANLGWPCVLSAKRESVTDGLAIVKLLGVGEEADFGISAKKRWQVFGSTRANEVAVDIVCTIKANQKWLAYRKGFIHERKNIPCHMEFPSPPKWVLDCAALPPFSKASAVQWFEIGWQAILEATNGQPENDARLREIGKYRERHSIQQGHQKSLTSHTADVNIRDGIRTRIRDALARIART